MNKNKKIYLDYAAATPLDARVKKEMLKAEKVFGNPSSAHSFGREAENLLYSARKKIGGVLNAKPENIIFTGSATESCNLAVLGAAYANSEKGKHIIISNIEHSAVLEPCRYLEKNGFSISYIGVGKNGVIDPRKIIKAVRKSTILVSIMHANHEIGTIQPIKKIAALLKQEYGSGRPLFHTDACHAPGALNLDVQQLGVDLMTLNASKIYGPKGIGCLYARHLFSIEPIIFGGGQEFGLRSGTQSPVLAAGLASAIKLAHALKEKEQKRLSKLRDYLIRGILSAIPGSELNGDAISRLPNNINVSFKGIDHEMLMLALDAKGIGVSTGSACSSGSSGPSRILKAIGQKNGALRITLGRKTTKQEIDTLLKHLPLLVEKYRSLA